MSQADMVEIERNLRMQRERQRESHERLKTLEEVAANMEESEVERRRRVEGGVDVSNGYGLPHDCRELQELISYKDMNAQIGEIFKTCYKYGRVVKAHNVRDVEKILFYANAELERLEQEGEV